MANVLPFSTRVAVVAALVEGNSIRATGRLTGVDKNTVMDFGVTVGQGCARLHNRLVTGLHDPVIELDEIWGYVGKKERRKTPVDPVEFGDCYTFVAVATISKLVMSYLTDKRTLDCATTFLRDLRARVVGKPQISADGWPSYPEAMWRAFGRNGADFGVIVKEYENDSAKQAAAHRYSPGRVKSVSKRSVYGAPDETLISTSYIERQNLTMRMHLRRLTRLTNAFSKKAENLQAAIALHFAYYNFVRVHETLKTTPAVAAGIADHVWSLGELVAAALAEPEASPEVPPPAPGPVRPEGQGPSASPTVCRDGAVAARVVREVPRAVEDAPARPMLRLIQGGRA